MKIRNMPVPLHCTLTLKLRITQRIIPVYVCVSVCLPACLSVCLSIHPFILLSVSACLFYFRLHLISTFHCPQRTHALTQTFPSCLFAAFSFSLANERSACKVCLNDQHHVITFVTVSLLSAHNCYCQLQNYMAAKPLSFTLQQHQDALFSSIFTKRNNTVLPHSTVIACPSPLSTGFMIMQHFWYFANAFIASRDYICINFILHYW